MRVQVNHLMNICREMETHMNKINGQIYELDKIIDSISFDASLDTIKSSLKKQQELLISEKRKLNQMIRCLERVCESAVLCEQNVMEELEQSKISYQPFSLEWLRTGTWVTKMLE